MQPEILSLSDICGRFSYHKYCSLEAKFLLHVVKAVTQQHHKNLPKPCQNCMLIRFGDVGCVVKEPNLVLKTAWVPIIIPHFMRCVILFKHGGISLCLCSLI